MHSFPLFIHLEIFKQGCSFKTRHYFKPTNRNRYITLDSCHHHSWLYNIPRGQFIRLRQNCTLDSDYYVEANILADCFLQKGYTKEYIAGDIDSIGNLDRVTLVAASDKNKKKKDNSEYEIILDYNIQNKKFEKIIMGHWDILKKDLVF